MKRVYFIYVAIPEVTFNTIKYMLGNTEQYRWKHDKMFGLYAWTSSKSIAKEFFEVRNKDIYTLIKKDVDEDELNHLKSDYNLLKLERRIYYLNGDNILDKSVEIVSTKNEYVCVTSDSEEYMWEFGPQIEEDTPYRIFNDKIIEALDTIGYNNGYDLRYGTDAEIDAANYNASFGLTPLGKRQKIVYDNQMNILLYLFKFFFYGEKRVEVE